MKAAKITKTTVDSINAKMIAPCGMNCSLCFAHIRDKKKCPGCNEDDVSKPRSCVACVIKNCGELENSDQKFCYICSKFPCKRLRNLDKRYRTKYGMSMIENLGSIQENGIDVFVDSEKLRWNCSECGGIISVHRSNCIYCDSERKGRQTAPETL